MLIYTHRITNRLEYIFKQVFSEMLGVPYTLTTDDEAFAASELPKISYAYNPVGGELFFHAKNLLFETGINEQNISVIDWENTKAFFSTGKKSALPFDPFAASFFLLSRYEECLPHRRDNYDRFEAKESIAYQHGFLKKPIVNIWVKKIKELLKEKFPSLQFKENSYQYLSTIDIDNAYAYKRKGLLRTIGAFGKDIISFNMPQLKERIKVLAGALQDPYDTYDYQFALQEKYKFRPLYFFLLADYDVNDKNVPHHNRKFQSLIKSIADRAEVGIHPSFNSNKKAEKIELEIDRLSDIVHREITKSRQHFLILHFPKTYRNLIDLDITDEYSMGYAQETGFRAGICTPFNYYDLDLETATKLKIHPFTVMDATLKYYMKITPDEAIEHVKQMVQEVKAVNGIFISLWHNETLSEKDQWLGWRKVYEETIKAATA
jgi:hypothetical protein